MLPDKPPSWIRWRNTTLSIISGIGPERIAPEWWQGDLQRDTFSERDYFTIQDTFGRWLWVFREQRSQQWFMHGVWT
jgi:protein ImuB